MAAKSPPPVSMSMHKRFTIELTQWKEQYNCYETKAQNLLDDCVKFEVFTGNAADSINHLKAYKKDTARKYNIPEPCLVT